MMGMRMPKICWAVLVLQSNSCTIYTLKHIKKCWAVFKRQAMNLRDWCVWLVDLFEYMMMHGLTNLEINLEMLQ
jgi:hypothetical protein